MSVDLSEFQTRTQGKCKAREVIKTLSAEDQEKVNAALKSPDITTISIVAFIKKREKTIARTTLQYHRRGECTCG